MVKGTLVLLRHGQTEDNVKRVASGHNDVPLTPLGKQQARAAGQLLGNIRFDKVYSSPLSRAFNTAQLALEGLAAPPLIEKRNEIIEIDNGALSGRSMIDDPGVIDYFKRATFDESLPGGESEKSLIVRVRKFYEEEVVPRLERGENVLIVSHTNTIRAFYIAMGVTPLPADGQPWNNKKHVSNAAPNISEYVDGKLKKSYDIGNPGTALNNQSAKKATIPKP